MTHSHANRRPCIFFDRDGIVNEAPKTYYLEEPAAFFITTAFLRALQIATDKGYVAVIVTNQKGVSTGVVSPATLEAIHDKMHREITAAGLSVLDVFSATSGDDAHPWRKPNPGMLLDAAEKHGLDLSASWMIGDSPRDAVAGTRAGCQTILVGCSTEEPSDIHLECLDELPQCLAKHIPECAG